ncbi:MAG: M55 family metallopeptidase [Candidatus Bathyarchaeota archaeon]|nr:M55 family metallopeptidase [Candidatus Bathyarchaeota archaeon]MDH5787708.1 M55 family metallopeptidase [Candidatus Bathyarchaeota archaeon]
MKAFISVDMEGMPYVVIPGHLSLKGTLYKEARKIATKVTVTVAEELHKSGFDEVVIADSHGPMVNLLVNDLPEYVEIVRGYPRPMSMVAGVEGCDAAVFLGYHAKFGTPKAAFDHTYSGSSVHKLEINGVEVSEFLLNSYAAGDFNVPVIMVAGDAQLIKDDVKKYAPWAETVALKHALSRVSARSFSMAKIEKELRKATLRAAVSFKKNKTKPLVTRKPVNVKIGFLATHFADVAALVPTVKRIDGLNIEYVASNMIDAYKTFELLALASAGISALLTNAT